MQTLTGPRSSVPGDMTSTCPCPQALRASCLSLVHSSDHTSHLSWCSPVTLLLGSLPTRCHSAVSLLCSTTTFSTILLSPLPSVQVLQPSPRCPAGVTAQTMQAEREMPWALPSHHDYTLGPCCCPGPLGVASLFSDLPLLHQMSLLA